MRKLSSILLLMFCTFAVWAQGSPTIQNGKVVYYFDGYSQKGIIKGTTDSMWTAKEHQVWAKVYFDSIPWDTLYFAVYDNDGEAINAIAVKAGAPNANKAHKLANGGYYEEVGVWSNLFIEGKQYRVLISNSKLPQWYEEAIPEAKSKKR